MRTSILLAIVAFSTAVWAAEQPAPQQPVPQPQPAPIENPIENKTLLYCDYTSQEYAVYLDLYFDHDAASDTYRNLEVGVLNEQNLGYPDYLWTVTTAYTPGSPLATVAIVNDVNTLSFEFPVKADAALLEPAYLITKTDDKIDGFEMIVKGIHMGNNVDATFTCYDPQNGNAQGKMARH